MSQYTKNTIEIPRECFKYRDGYTQIATEQETFTPLTQFVWNKGIFLFLEGAEQPQRNLTSPETMWAINLSKRLFVEALRFLAKWYFAPAYLIIALLPFKKKVKILEHALASYNSVTWKNFSPYILKTEFMTGACQELEWTVYSFLHNVGVSPTVCDQFSEVFSGMIDYDNAYRLRIEDLFEETTNEALRANPSKEIGRLLAIYGQRQGMTKENEMYRKFKYFTYILRTMLLYPKFKKAFMKTLYEIDVKKMGFGVEDRYWACLRSNEYLFMGKTQEEREKMITKKPLLVKRKQ